MKTIILSLILALSAASVSGQSKEDSIRLRAEIEAISMGREVKYKGRESVVQSRVPQLRVDTAALKSGYSSPTPSNPNNPNPYQPVPSIMNAEPPARAAYHRVTPVGTPTAAGGPSKRNY